MRDLKKLFPIFGILIIAAGLRFSQLGNWSFWIDEVLTVLDAREISISAFPINPIPYLAVKFSIVLFGDTEFGARVISAIIGTISVWLIFEVGKSIGNRRIGYFSAIFLAVSNWHLFWSQNARSYVFTLFFTLLVAFYLFTAIERKQIWRMILAIISAILLILSHTLSGVMIGSLAIYVILIWRFEQKFFDHRRWKMIVIFFVPFILPIFLLLFERFRSYLFSGWGFNIWKRSSFYIVTTLIYGVSVPIAITAFFASIQRPFNRPKVLLICWAIVPLLFFLICSNFLNVTGYYLFFTLPAYLLLAAIECDRFYRIDKRGLILPLILIGVMLSQDFIYFRIENGGRPKWREAFQTVKDQITIDDLIVVSVKGMAIYYLPNFEAISIKTAIEQLDKLTDRKGKVWFLVDLEDFNVFDRDGKIRIWIETNAKKIVTHRNYARFRDRSIEIYRMD